MEINLSEFAGGAVQERFGIEFKQVLANMMDPNTDFRKARKLQLTLTFQTDENRNLASVTVDAKATLAPASGISTTILMDRDSAGNAVGAEFVQTSLFEQPAVSGNVTPLNQKSGGR